MATEITFGGKRIKQPGAYSLIKSGITNPPLALDFGNALIIDTGQSSGFGGGSGVNGELDQNKKSIYAFNRVSDFRDFVHGGFWWMIAEALFRPGGAGVDGVSTLHYVRAGTTTAATASWNPVGGGTNGGDVTFQVKNEGEVGNGVETGGELTQGYAFVMKVGTVDPSKFVLEFYRGTFKGSDSEGDPYDFIAAADALPELVARSAEFATVDEFKNWADNSSAFQAHFNISAFTSNGDGSVDAADQTTYQANTLFAGGTESFSATDLDDALTALQDVDYTFVLAPDSGADAQSADNGSILAHIDTEARYDKFMVVGAQDGETDFSTSIGDAQFYDSEQVIVVHGGVNVNAPTVSGLKQRGAVYKAAQVLGRIAGLEPQVPGTFKNLNYHSEVHDITNDQANAALDAGLLVTRLDPELNDYVIVQAVNSLQDNSNIVNQNGDSHEISVERIKAQLNKELIVNSKRQLLGNPSGTNRSTLSEETIKNWTAAYLDRRTATETDDNLIIGYQNISVEVQQDAYLVNYEFEPNFPVNKLLFTGFIIDPTS